MAYKIEQLKEWLTEHAQLKEQMAEGEAYFNQQNTAILETKKQMGIIRNDKNGKRTVMVEDPYASNEKLASGFLKQQIKQKVNYLINENITLSDMVEETEELYPDWRKDLKQLSTRVSYHIYGAWQFYVEDNETKYNFIDGTQLYPIFITNQSIPDLVIRHYTTMDGIEKAIIYSNTTETHYIKKKKWEYEKEVPIIRKSKVIADETIEEQSVELSQPPLQYVLITTSGKPTYNP